MEFNYNRFVKLSEVTSIIGDGLHGTPNYSNNGKYYFINGRNLKGKISIDDTTKKVNHKEFQKYSKKLSDRTILLSINGTIGNTAYYNNENIILGKSACYLNILNAVDKDYIYYLLNAPRFKEYAYKYSTGTTIKNLGLKAIRDYKFYLPSFKNQKKISRMIKKYDEKIEINNKIIANLEAQAQAIFKSWFVDFEPLQDENFVESELGLIPEGWEVSTIGAEFDIEYGKNLPTKKLIDKGYPVFGGNGQIGFYDDYLYEKPRLLVSCRGAASGKVGMSKPFSFVTNNSLIFNEKITDYFFYYKELFTNIKFENYVTGSAQPQLTISNSKNINIIVPSKKSLLKFNKIIEPIFDLKLIITNQNQTLAQTRDTLLPKLMNGEIDVSNIKIDDEDSKDE